MAITRPTVRPSGGVPGSRPPPISSRGFGPTDRHGFLAQGLARAGGGAGGDAAEFEDVGAALSMVSGGLGTAIMPRLSLEGVPDDVGITDPGPERPIRSFGCLTAPEQARSLAVRALIRELRMGDAKPPSQIVGSPSNCGDRPAGLP